MFILQSETATAIIDAFRGADQDIFLDMILREHQAGVYKRSGEALGKKIAHLGAEPIKLAVQEAYNVMSAGQDVKDNPAFNAFRKGIFTGAGVVVKAMLALVVGLGALAIFNTSKAPKDSKTSV